MGGAAELGIPISESQGDVWVVAAAYPCTADQGVHRVDLDRGLGEPATGI